MQENGAFKNAYPDWEQERSFGRLRPRPTDFWHGTCDARRRLDEAPADTKVAALEGKVAELEAKLEAKNNELEAKNNELATKFAALEAKLTTVA